MQENVKNLQNHFVGRRFQNETKPQETFHCAVNALKKNSTVSGLQNDNFFAMHYMKYIGQISLIINALTK